MYRSQEQIVNRVIVVLAGRTGGRDVPQSGADCQPGKEEDGRR